jgi:threonine/homoserine/homoserine lactone efflux protein
MLPTGHLLAFALLSFVLIIVPGPNVIFVITRSLMLGRVAGVSTAVGGQIGVYAQVAAVAFGGPGSPPRRGGWNWSAGPAAWC